MGGSFGIDDYFLETDGDEADDEYDQVTANSLDVEQPHSYLSVPQKVIKSCILNIFFIIIQMHNQIMVYKNRNHPINT